MTQKQSGWAEFESRLYLNEVHHTGDFSLVHHAYVLAELAHAGQTRMEWEGGVQLPYFVHPRRTVWILVEELGVNYSQSLIATLLLHDVLEDTSVPASMIHTCFGSDVANLVKGLSKIPKEGYLERLIASSDWRLGLAKGCDRLDNLRSLPKARSEKFKQKKIQETHHYMPLFEGLSEKVFDPFSRRASDRLCDLIRAEMVKLEGGPSRPLTEPQQESDKNPE